LSSKSNTSPQDCRQRTRIRLSAFVRRNDTTRLSRFIIVFAP
jgi:hypothetical protein